MKAESNVMPQAYVIDKLGEQAIITFAENVIEAVVEAEIKYEYDSYSMVVPYREELPALVEEEYQAWIESAKAMEQKPAAPPTAEDRLSAIEDALLMIL